MSYHLTKSFHLWEKLVYMYKDVFRRILVTILLVIIENEIA